MARKLITLENEFHHTSCDVPDLLAALKGILAAVTQPATYPADLEYVRRIARAAIAKAEGQS